MLADVLKDKVQGERPVVLVSRAHTQFERFPKHCILETDRTIGRRVARGPHALRSPSHLIRRRITFAADRHGDIHLPARQPLAHRLEPGPKRGGQTRRERLLRHGPGPGGRRAAA